MEFTDDKRSRRSIIKSLFAGAAASIAGMFGV
ncbi:hypothetical protein SAMN06265218_1101, partial [Fodinibius sediminis]